MYSILMTTLFYKALILQGESWYWSLLGLKGLKVTNELSFGWLHLRWFYTKSQKLEQPHAGTLQQQISSLSCFFSVGNTGHCLRKPLSNEKTIRHALISIELHRIWPLAETLTHANLNAIRRESTVSNLKPISCSLKWAVLLLLISFLKPSWVVTQISWLTCAVCLLWSAVFAWNSPLPFFRRGQRNVAKNWGVWSCTKYFLRSESACTFEKKKQSGCRILTRSVKTKKLVPAF